MYALGPFLVPVSAGSFSAPPVQVQLANNLSLIGLRIINKGPFDVKYSGSINGDCWIVAGTSVPFHLTINDSLIFLSGMSSEANVDSMQFHSSLYSTVLIQEYILGDEFFDEIYNIPIANMSPDCRILEAKNCAGTNVIVPKSTSQSNPYENANQCYLLGFDLTSGTATASAPGDFLIQNISGFDGQSNELAYRLRSDTVNIIQILKLFPRNGLPLSDPTKNITFVVPTLSNITFHLNVYYSFYPGVQLGGG